MINRTFACLLAFALVTGIARAQEAASSQPDELAPPTAPTPPAPPALNVFASVSVCGVVTHPAKILPRRASRADDP